MRVIKYYNNKKLPTDLKEAIEKYQKGINKVYPQEADNVGSKYQSAAASLKILFKSKCAYCDHKASGFEVDHYRPKKLNEKRKEKYHQNYKGYYWLAYEWSNLLLVCGLCNRKKSDRFPLINDIESNRIYEPLKNENGEILFFIKEYQKKENPALLNPILDNADEHLFFNQYGKVKAKTIDNVSSFKGEKSIEHYSLNRHELIKLRGEVITEEFMHQRIFDYYKKETPPSREVVEHLLNGIIHTLIRQIEDEKESFIALRKTILKNFKEFVLQRSIVLKKGEKEIEVPKIWIECFDELKIADKIDKILDK